LRFITKARFRRKLVYGSTGIVTTTVGTATLTIGWTNFSNSFDGVIKGAVALTKIGTGTETLTGNNKYTGATTINGGTLLINGTQPNSAVTVNAGGILGGGGTVEPGLAGGTGILSSGNAALNSGSTFAAELNGATAGSGNGPTAGSDYNQLNVAGTVNLGNSTLSLSLGSGFSPSPLATFTLIKASKPIIGTFSGLSEGSTITVDRLEFTISYLNDEVVLTYQTAAGG
jgi:fibronectin-binding autotransporter adhesin